VHVAHNQETAYRYMQHAGRPAHITLFESVGLGHNLVLEVSMASAATHTSEMASQFAIGLSMTLKMFKGM
jgi:hypothetical protein